jgi:hypothetical protein
MVVETCRNQFVANLAVKLFMEGFIRSVIQPNHFKRHDRMTAARRLIP